MIGMIAFSFLLKKTSEIIRIVLNLIIIFFFIRHEIIVFSLILLKIVNSFVIPVTIHGQL